MDMKDTLLAVSGLLGGSGGGGSSGPLITQQPSDVSGEIGVTVHFSVTASGTGLTYMWQSNMYEEWRDTSFSTSTTATLALKVAQERDGVQYRCKITDGEGHVVYSHPATLRVATTAPVLIAKTFTENGTYAAADDSADGYDTVTVNVQGTGEYIASDWLDPTKPTGKIVSSTLFNHRYNYSGFFARRTGSTQVFLSAATMFSDNMFDYNTGMTSLVAPQCQSAWNMACRGTTAMQAADLKGGGTIGANSFNSSGVTVLVLRGQSVSTLGDINAFAASPFASGKAGGTLYVPRALISTYESATNWTTILGYPNNQILPIEGSIYETQYVDGTPIS